MGHLIRFHQRLNPRLWRHDRLRTEVRLKLLKTAVAFYRFLDLSGLQVHDIILTGSNAAYNYTALSDLDVHLLVAYNTTACPSLADNFFGTKKTLWNQTYDIMIHNHPVELYVEDTASPVRANGVYSILHSTWLKTPSAIAPKHDDTAVSAKVEAYAEEIDALLVGTPQAAAINDVLHRLYALRQNGLLNGGEYSTENISYKVLRNLGYMQKLYDARITLRDKELSI